MNRRIDHLDGLRALAVLAVVGFHWVRPYADLFEGGYVGVDVFFVLSGFLITGLLANSMRTAPALGPLLATFLRRRVVRLYPALLGLVVVGSAIVVAVGRPTDAAHTLGSALLAVAQAGSPELATGSADLEPFGQTWSLSVEWIFYLVWPLVLWVLLDHSDRPHRPVYGLAAVAYLGSLAESAEWFYYGPSSRAAQLLVGGALALQLGHRPTSRVSGRTWTVVAVAGIAATCAWIEFGPFMWSPAYRYIGFPIATFTAWAVIMAGTFADRSVLVGLLERRPMVLLGQMSYSLYLWHQLPMKVLDKDQIHISMAILGACGVASAVMLTTLSYVLLEQPFVRRRATPPALARLATLRPSA